MFCRLSVTVFFGFSSIFSVGSFLTSLLASLPSPPSAKCSEQMSLAFVLLRRIVRLEEM
jgi:hypothetical protein